MNNLTIHDFEPVQQSFQDAVTEGLSRTQKAIPPKFFYDERGSELFDRICDQPEYYPTTVERDMLERLAPEIAELCGKGRVLIEPGAGNASKVRLLLDDLRPSAFVPMDISFDYLKSAARDLAGEYPWLPVHAVCVDFTHSLPVPDQVPEGKRLLFFPGSSIGNFSKPEARGFLEMVRETADDDGMALIGVDTKKDNSLLNAAYNDMAGVTAAFNLNLLHRMRDELGAECNPEDFEHKAFYNSDVGRIEMHLQSKRQQEISLDGNSFPVAKGECLHTENSYKYSPKEFMAMAAECDLDCVQHWLGDDHLFGVYLLKAA